MEAKDFESALISVISELNAPKSQFNKFGGYYFRNAEDIVEAVKPLLAKAKLRMKISDAVVFIEGRFYIEAKVTVKGYGCEDFVTAYARESETKKGMDDSQVTGATSSYARKYALNGMFNIDDEKDADTNEHQAKRTEGNQKKASPNKLASEAQKQLIVRLYQNSGVELDDIPAILAASYGIEQGTPMTSAQADQAIKDLKERT